MSAAPPSTAASPGTQPAIPATAPYAVRAITVTLNIGKGSFGSNGSTSLTIQSPTPGATVGPRVLVHVENVSIPSTGLMQVRIWGMTLSDMNDASKAGVVFDGRENTVTVTAGDALSGMTTFYKGTIFEAYPDFKSQPDVSFFIQANAATIPQLKPVPPTSFPGQVPAATAFQSLAKAAGLTLENNGISAVLQSPYFPGTAWSQILSAIKAVDCYGVIDGVNKVLAIWPKTGARSGGPILISADTGMVGYPSFQQNQIIVTTIFNPALVQSVGPGHQIQVKSQLTAANGTFTCSAVTHDLAAQIPKGPWFTTVLATPVKS